MFDMSVPWWEFVVRGAVVYAFLFVLLRLTGKRQVGQLAPFDLILLLILSNAVQNSMNAGDDSLTGGLIIAGTLIAINWSLAFAACHNPTIERLLEGTPQIVVKDGQINREILAREHISEEDLRAGLRLAGSFSTSQVEVAMLETNGHLSVKLKDGAVAS